MKNKRSVSRGAGLSEEESLLNLTPLIDVVFVVLIIFILISPMLEIDNVKLASSSALQTKQAATAKSSPVLIHVDADNSIRVNQKKISLESLLSTLQKEKQRAPKEVPQLFHDKKAYFGTYQTVKNALEIAGFEEVDVILQPGSS